MPEIIVKLGDRVIHRYFFDKEMLSVGRARDNDIVIENLSVSRNHARIKKQDDKFILTDMNSANGTLVNGVRISKTELSHDDQITVGKHVLHFLAVDGQTSADPSSGVQVDVPAPTAQLSSVAPSTGIVGLLTVVKGKQAGTDFRIFKPTTSIGRASENDIRLHDWFVSKKHAAINREGDAWILKDLDSWRGTTVNGKAINSIQLSEGMEIIFGTTVLSFRLADAATLPKYVPPDPESEVFEELEFGEAPGSKTSDAVARLTASQVDIDLPSNDEYASFSEEELDEQLENDNEFSTSRSLEPVDEDDEFAPMTDDELEALEQDADLHMESDSEEEEHRRATWEMLEMERMYEQDGAEEHFSMIDSDHVLTEEENQFIGAQKEFLSLKAVEAGKAEQEAVALEEEESLYGGPMTDLEPYGERPVEAPVKSPSSSAGVGVGAVLADGTDPEKQKSIELWERALKNKSSVIRKNAARELKKLTGKDYDWQSEPVGS